MNKLPMRILLALVLTCPLLLTSCRSQPKADGEAAALTVGMEATPVNSLIYIAEEQGYFAENDLELDIRDDYPSGAAATEAMLAGDVEISTSAELGVVRNALEGRGLVTHASIDEFLHQYLIARRDRGIAEPDDLKGKTVGVPLGTGAEFSFERYLDLHGIEVEQLRIVDVQAPEAVAALTGGSVDAVVAWQPNAATLRSQLGDGVTVRSVQNMQPTFCLTVTSQEWAQENEQVLDRFLRALARADDFVVSQPDEARRIIQNRLGYDDAYMSEIWPEHELTLSLDQSLILAMEDQAQWLVQKQSVVATPLPDFSDFVDPEPLRQVRPESVNVVR